MSNLSPQIQKIIDAYYSVYPVSGWYEYEGERLSIAAVLRVLANQYDFADTKVGVTEKVILVDDILKIIEELEQF